MFVLSGDVSQVQISDLFCPSEVSVKTGDALFSRQVAERCSAAAATKAVVA